jgi:cullin 3
MKLGFDRFHEMVLMYSSISATLQSTLHAQVAKDRAGESVERSLLQSLLQMLVDVQDHSFYLTYFENKFVSDSLEHFQAEANQCLASMDCSQYLQRVRHVITQETERTQRYLQLEVTQSVQGHKIQSTINEAFLTSFVQKILVELNNAEVYMLENDKFDDLQLMYTLMKRVNGHNAMRDVLRNHVETKGKAIVTNEEYIKSKDKTFIQPVLDLKDKYDDILLKSFFSDKDFRSTLSASYEAVINATPRSPEFLSLYVDDRFRKHTKETNETDLEKTLDKVMVMYRLLKEKDLFEKYYKNHLAKRLLNGRSAEDAERMMITRLKTDSGFQFTSKLESMFRDIKVSETSMEAFKELVRQTKENTGADPLGGTDLSVSVLTTGSWPTQQQYTCTLPPQLQNCVELFAKFYNKSHSGRKLTWQTNMGTADLRATFGSSRKELSVPTQQMIVLMLFNEYPSITGKEIQSLTNIPFSELKRHLLTLTHARTPILTITKDDSVQADDLEHSTFNFNNKFTHKLVRIKIALVSQKETEAEREGTKSKMDEERTNIIDAAIVRTMKASKLLDHNNLIAEVTRQVTKRFHPSVSHIKKRIESLIEREFLKRADNRNTYEYLA